MNEREARRAVADAGRMLLREKLVARTWGNVSCRTGAQSFVITPSGLGYEHMEAEDVVHCYMDRDTWTGSRAPSSERGVHTAAYRRFPEAGAVIHTHQTYASALGLAGFDMLSPEKETRCDLGGLALAEYGLPGTKRLAANVSEALSSGAHTVLMARHGALIVGEDMDEAFRRAKLLEEVCRSACRGQPAGTGSGGADLAALAERTGGRFPHVAYTAAPAVIEASISVKSFRAQLDDMAQMIGPRVITVEPDAGALEKELRKRSAVLVSGAGAICRADTEGDCEALRLLVEKACICFLHTRAAGITDALSPFDALLMRNVYLKKYSKKIGV